MVLLVKSIGGWLLRRDSEFAAVILAIDALGGKLVVTGRNGELAAVVLAIDALSGKLVVTGRNGELAAVVLAIDTLDGKVEEMSRMGLDDAVIWRREWCRRSGEDEAGDCDENRGWLHLCGFESC
jgi:PHD/YefM family antitoxin component YafN of YafNO toxin-antitoxin module